MVLALLLADLDLITVYSWESMKDDLLLTCEEKAVKTKLL